MGTQSYTRVNWKVIEKMKSAKSVVIVNKEEFESSVRVSTLNEEFTKAIFNDVKVWETYEEFMEHFNNAMDIILEFSRALMTDDHDVNENVKKAYDELCEEATKWQIKYNVNHKEEMNKMESIKKSVFIDEAELKAAIGVALANDEFIEELFEDLKECNNVEDFTKNLAKTAFIVSDISWKIISNDPAIDDHLVEMHKSLSEFISILDNNFSK